MHELSVSRGLVDTVLEEAERLKAAKVISVSLIIGKCSCVSPDILTDYYHLFTEDTIADKSELKITRQNAHISCQACGVSSEIPDFRLVCPLCGSKLVTLISGRECYIDAMEIEEE